MDGDLIRAQAIRSRRFSPPDSPRTFSPPGRLPPTWHISSHHITSHLITSHRITPHHTTSLATPGRLSPTWHIKAHHDLPDYITSLHPTTLIPLQSTSLAPRQPVLCHACRSCCWQAFAAMRRLHDAAAER